METVTITYNQKKGILAFIKHQRKIMPLKTDTLTGSNGKFITISAGTLVSSIFRELISLNVHFFVYTDKIYIS
jgi:hypothetical protein